VVFREPFNIRLSATFEIFPGGTYLWDVQHFKRVRLRFMNIEKINQELIL